MQWDEVQQEQRNGEILGYRVLYSVDAEPEKTKTVNAPTRKTSLTDLRKATVYTIKVLAFTGTGDGPASSGNSVTTDEDSKCNVRC